MATAKLLFLSVTVLVCVVAAVDKSTTTVSPSRTVVPHPSTTKGLAPTTTPTPKPPAVAQYNYANTTNSKLPCRIRLNGDMAWTFTYNPTTKNTTKTVKEFVNGTAEVLNDNCSCIHRKSAKLVLRWYGMNGTKTESRNLTFDFTADTRKSHMSWQLKKVILDFNISEEVFPDYPTNHSRNATLYSKDFIDNTNSDVEYQRSYKCNASRVLKFKNTTNISLAVSLDITNFRVQAFDFKDPNSTESAFGNARNCPTDATGKKIVPIAVGIALGVLVIAVIVAFIISKIVNRKKSGYEALN